MLLFLVTGFYMQILSLHIFSLQFYSFTLWLQEGNKSQLLEESV